MKLFICWALLIFAFGCKTPGGSSEVRSSGAFDTTSGKACLVWIKDKDVYYKHCPMQSNCEPTDGKVVMSEQNYIKKLYEQYGVTAEKTSDIDRHLGELDAKYKNFVSIKVELEKIKISDPKVFADEMQKAEERIFGTALSREEALNLKSVLKTREGKANKILATVRDAKAKKMSVIAVPDIAAALTPIFGNDISNCFEEAKAPQMVASVVAQKEAQTEWDTYQSWASAPKTPPLCVPVVPQAGFEALLKDWYVLKFSAGYVNYSSRSACEAARTGARSGVVCEWGYDGTNYRLISSGKVVGHNPATRMVVEEGGQKTYPKGRNLEDCITDLKVSSQIVADFPDFIAVPKYDDRFRRIGNTYEIVALWNNKTVIDNLEVLSPQTPPPVVKPVVQLNRPKQPNTTAIFNGTPPTGTGNGSAGNTNGNSGTTNPGTTNPGTTNPGTTNPGGTPTGSSNVAQVQRLVGAMKAAAAEFSYVTPSTRDACLSATVTASEPWSDLMAHYYCLFPVQDTSNAYSVRACFTGSLRGQAPYQKAQGRPAAYAACINRPEFAWLKASRARADDFELIMALGPKNIPVNDQNKIISEFYGNNPVPVR